MSQQVEQGEGQIGRCGFKKEGREVDGNQSVVEGKLFPPSIVLGGGGGG